MVLIGSGFVISQNNWPAAITEILCDSHDIINIHTVYGIRIPSWLTSQTTSVRLSNRGGTNLIVIMFEVSCDNNI